jgi:hypothetical protein
MNIKNGFTRIQETEWMRAGKVLKYLSNNQAKVDTYLPLKNKKLLLEAILNAIDAQLTKKTFETKGNTQEKKQARNAVADFYDRVLAIVLSYLNDKGNKELAVNFRHTKRDILRMDDGDVLPFVMKWNKWIEEDVIPEADFDPYEITAATLTEGLNLAHSFNEYMGTTAIMQVDRRLAGKSIAELLKKLKFEIRQAALLMKHFQKTDPHFYNGFRAANKVDNLGIRHTTIHGKVTLDGQPLNNAEIICLNTVKKPKTATSNLLGIYSLPGPRPGTYDFRCTAPNLEPLIKTLTIKRGKPLECNWRFD